GCGRVRRVRISSRATSLCQLSGGLLKHSSYTRRVISFARMNSTSPHAGQLKRSVGFWGLMFVSLGSIIGSGWLLGALNAAEAAGPASILSWLLAAGMLALLALVYAE